MRSQPNASGVGAMSRKRNFNPRRLLPVLTLLMSSSLDRAQAACTPEPPVNNATAICTGTTTNQNGTNGYGAFDLSNNTITVQPGASVTGTFNGVVLVTGTINNFGTAFGDWYQRRLRCRYRECREFRLDLRRQQWREHNQRYAHEHQYRHYYRRERRRLFSGSRPRRRHSTQCRQCRCRHRKSVWHPVQRAEHELWAEWSQIAVRFPQREQMVSAFLRAPPRQ